MREIMEPLAERVPEAHVYTMRELNQNTAQVIDAINKSGRPAAVTKHGRYVALIQPLVNATVETVVSTDSSAARVLESRAEQDSPM